METEALRAAIEVETTGHLWGTPHIFTPRLVDQVFGDGRRLMGLTTINNRPAYWVFRVGSDWNCGSVNGWEDLPEDAPRIEYHVDEILEAIEDQFGRWDPEEEFEYALAEAKRRKKRRPVREDFYGRTREEFPRCDDSDGCSWFGVYWPDLPRQSLRPATPDQAKAGEVDHG